MGIGVEYGSGMRRYLLAFLPLCLHCGGSSTSAPPAEEAPTTPAEPAAAEEAPTASPADSAEAAPPEAAASAAPAAGGLTSPGKSSGKPDCPTLKKEMCKVTAGCAWSEGPGAPKKCVAEGP